jgi:protein-L-isoaspartate(D-aspartate) O-methyltransferase
MTNERAKRFPLALADLVREPRKPAARPGEARVQSALKPALKPALKSVAGGAGNTSAARAPALVQKARVATGKSASTGGAKAASNHASGHAPKQVLKHAVKPAAVLADHAVHATRRAAVAVPGHKPPSGAYRKSGAAGTAPKPSTIVAHHQPGALRTAASHTETRERDSHAAARKSAGNAGSTGAHALASERVRERMVERLRANGITDTRVLNAMAAVPRHLFVDPALAAQAYEDAALPIGHHQTISKPSVVARMIELVAAGRTLGKVLEIGTGCGYQAAVLSRIAADVYSIERVRPLSERAKVNLRPLRVPNIRLHYGDGRLGLPAAAPFDAIVIACAGLDVPQALLDQLAVGGRLVAPVGSQAAQAQILTLIERVSPTQWRESQLDRVFFVPLKSGVI